MELVPLDSWFGLIYFESIVFSVGIAVFVVAFIRERGEARQRAAAETDPLTGVSTRRALLEQAEEALRRCQAADEPLSLVVFDLDRFKSVNDRFGHAAGDAVLRRFGDTVRTVLREDDRLGRLGGEEFALLLPGMSLGAAFVVAERVREAFEVDCKTVEGKEIGGTVSAGWRRRIRDSTVQSMLIAADEGLYEAKASGRNRVERRRPRSAGTASPSSTAWREAEAESPARLLNSPESADQDTRHKAREGSSRVINSIGVGASFAGPRSGADRRLSRGLSVAAGRSQTRGRRAGPVPRGILVREAIDEIDIGSQRMNVEAAVQRLRLARVSLRPSSDRLAALCAYQSHPSTAIRSAPDGLSEAKEAAASILFSTWFESDVVMTPFASTASTLTLGQISV